MAGYLIRRVKDLAGDGNIYFLRCEPKGNVFCRPWMAKKFASSREAWAELNEIKEYGVDYEIVHDHTLEPITANDDKEGGEK